MCDDIEHTVNDIERTIREDAIKSVEKIRALELLITSEEQHVESLVLLSEKIGFDISDIAFVTELGEDDDN